MHGPRAGEIRANCRPVQATPARLKNRVSSLAHRLIKYLIQLKAIVSSEPSLASPALATLERDPNLPDTQQFNQALNQPPVVAPQKTCGLKLSKTPSRALMPGEVVAERFEVIEPLSRGGFGQVFLALDRETGDRVVIKQKLFMDDRGAMECEHQAMSAINGGPQIPGYLGKFTTSDGQEVTVAEFIEGDNIRQLIHENEIAYSGRRSDLGYIDYSLSSFEAITDIALALAHAHERGYLHIDLKPENLIFNQATREATVIDWGLLLYGRLRQAQGDNVVFGTPSYMAPEQASGGILGPATDIYGLGIVLRQMFEGLERPPISGQPIQAIIRRAREGIAFEWNLDANRLFPAFSEALRDEIAAFMLGMTQYAVKERPQNMGEVEFAASKIAEGVRRERGVFINNQGLQTLSLPILYKTLSKVIQIYNRLPASAIEVLHRLRSRIADRNVPIEEFMLLNIDQLERALPNSRLIPQLRQIWVEAQAEAVRPIQENIEQASPLMLVKPGDLFVINERHYRIDQDGENYSLESSDGSVAIPLPARGRIFSELVFANQQSLLLVSGKRGGGYNFSVTPLSQAAEHVQGEYRAENQSA